MILEPFVVQVYVLCKPVCLYMTREGLVNTTIKLLLLVTSIKVQYLSRYMVTILVRYVVSSSSHVHIII
jgi:hypothetical protein